MKKTLRIIYDGFPDYELEKKLGRILKENGYKWYAQGFDHEDKKRDIAYDMPQNVVFGESAGLELTTGSGMARPHGEEPPEA